MWTWVSWYLNVSILDFMGAKDDGGGGNDWSYKTCKVQSSSQNVTINKPTPSSFYLVPLQAGCPSRRPTNSVRAAKGIPSSNSA